MTKCFWFDFEVSWFSFFPFNRFSKAISSTILGDKVGEGDSKKLRMEEDISSKDPPSEDILALGPDVPTVATTCAAVSSVPASDSEL